MIRRTSRVLALTIMLGLVASLPMGPIQLASGRGTDLRGGTLRVGMIFNFAFALDPQKEFDPELLQCCLVRTLLSYNGRPAAEGGTELFPDLASGMPSVSADGLTWTFHLKHGIRYAPPYQDTTITAPDFIRALERMATSTVVPTSFQLPYYNVIAGWDDFVAGRAPSISGLVPVDSYTLQIRLTQPTGDLGYRLALPGVSPIPPSKRDPTAMFGAADGHDGTYGPYLVASGPYMIEGSQWLDFTKPPDQQRPVFGFIPGKSLTLVRNPSWDRSTDALRPAYPDRIVISFPSRHGHYLTEPGPARKAAERELRAAEDSVEAGRLDLVADANPFPDEVTRYLRDPELRNRLKEEPTSNLGWVDFRLTIPPFDDPHVRKAASLAIEPLQLAQREWSDPLVTEVNHLVPDSLENDLLANYDPYPTNLQAAMDEMRLSRYDRNHDGICDSPVCRRVPFIDRFDPAAPVLDRDLRRIGIHLHIVDWTGTTRDPTAPRTRNAVAFEVQPGVYPNGSNLITARLAAGGFAAHVYSGGSLNFTLIGATRKQLESWGYPHASVPSVQGWIDQCQPLIGGRQTECWTELDQYVMERITPWVPLAVQNVATIVSARVVSYSFDQAFQAPALDRIALAPGSS